MEHVQLEELYNRLGRKPLTVYVAPRINYDFPDSDYLFNLYRSVTDSDSGIRIKSVSVFSHFKPFFKALTGRPVIFHYHWLEFQDFKALAGMPWKLLWLTLFRLTGGMLVWTIHNEEPHDGKWPGLHLFLHKKMAKYAAALHVHCRYAAGLMSKKLSADPNKFYIIPHPSFPASEMEKAEAVSGLNQNYDARLDPDRPVVLIFGQISHYKNIPPVLDDLKTLPGVQVIIAGTIKKGNKKLARQLEAAAENNPAITLITQFIPDAGLPLLFNASDLCVFNYKRILTSGGVHMALSYQKTVAAPAAGCIRELTGNPLVHTFRTGSERAELLKNLVRHV